MLFVLGPTKTNEEHQFRGLINSWLNSKRSVQELEDAINLLNKMDLGSKKEKAPNNYNYKVPYHAAAQDASRLYERLACAHFQPNNQDLSNEAQFMAELKKFAPHFNFNTAFTTTRIKGTPLDTQFMNTVYTSLTTAYQKLIKALQQKNPQILFVHNNKESIQGQKDRLFDKTPPRSSPKNTQTIPNDHCKDLRTIINAITNLDFNLHYGFGSKIKNGQRVSRGAAEIYNIASAALSNPSSANISDTFDKIHNILGTKTQPRWTLLGLGQRDKTTTELYQKLEDFICAKRKALNSENEYSLISRIMR